MVRGALEDRDQRRDAVQDGAYGQVVEAGGGPGGGGARAGGRDGMGESGRLPLDVRTGDVVLYSKYGGTEVKYNGEEYLVLSARDVLAIIEK
ncbi:co-chaperone GroES [Streptomyces albidoflavus]|uniref:co-chaperone GroES n=1 Tax=Streptomyces albidoflavus TaxID=1886 RepID=UPI00352706CB